MLTASLWHQRWPAHASLLALNTVILLLRKRQVQQGRQQSAVLVQDKIPEDRQQELAGLPRLEEMLRWILKTNPAERPSLGAIVARCAGCFWGHSEACRVHG